VRDGFVAREPNRPLYFYRLRNFHSSHFRHKSGGLS
jgi:hypothetical protein